MLRPDQAKEKMAALHTTGMIPQEQTEPDQYATFFRENIGFVTDVYVKAKVVTYHIGSYVVPAHTEWRDREIEDTYRDDHGKEWTRTRHISEPIDVPDQTVYTGTVGIRFQVYDAKTDKEIFSREEERTRDSSTDLRGIYKRICESFYSEFRKKVKP